MSSSREQWDDIWALVEVAQTAAALVAKGGGDQLVVIPLILEGGLLAEVSQSDDGVTCAAAIDVLRVLVAEYERVGN